MLQAQKLLKVEEVEVEAEEEPKGEVIVRLSREALRPPSTDTTFTQINFFSAWVYLDSIPLSSHFILEALWC